MSSIRANERYQGISSLVLLPERIATAIVIGLVAALIPVVAGRAAFAQEGKTVWDGVYTEEQATRGKAAYRKECASCHMEDLRGEGYAAPLIADAFTQRWQDGTLGDLFTSLKATMPADRPSVLENEAYADIVAYLLKMNNYPAGQQELSKDPNDLRPIVFKKPGEAAKP